MTQALDLLTFAATYPLRPGWKRRETSRAAADDTGSKVARLQRMVLAAITEAGAEGLTAHELAARLDMPNTTTAPRTSELSALGKIIDSGQRRLNPTSGKRAIVWVAVDGRQS